MLSIEDDSTLPQRLIHLRQSLVVPILAALLGCAVLAWRQLPWLVLIVIFSTLVGGFRLRKKLLNERWSLAAYLSFTVRLWLGFNGFWVVLAGAPWFLGALDRLIQTASPSRWPAALAVAVGLGL